MTYVVYPDEGHGVARPGNRELFNGMIEVFFGRCLGGQYQPLPSSIEGAHARAPYGVELIPGLEEALGGAAIPREREITFSP